MSTLKITNRIIEQVLSNVTATCNIPAPVIKAVSKVIKRPVKPLSASDVKELSLIKI